VDMQRPLSRRHHCCSAIHAAAKHCAPPASRPALPPRIACCSPRHRPPAPLRPCAHRTDTDTASRLDEAAVLSLSAQAASLRTRPPRRIARPPASARDHDEERDGRPPCIGREQLELALWRHGAAVRAPGLSARHARDRPDHQGHQPVRMLPSHRERGGACAATRRPVQCAMRLARSQASTGPPRSRSAAPQCGRVLAAVSRCLSCGLGRSSMTATTPPTL
jgi:hypothetical protein